MDIVVAPVLALITLDLVVALVQVVSVPQTGPRVVGVRGLAVPFEQGVPVPGKTGAAVTSSSLPSPWTGESATPGGLCPHRSSERLGCPAGLGCPAAVGRFSSSTIQQHPWSLKLIRKNFFKHQTYQADYSNTFKPGRVKYQTVGIFQ